MSPFALQLRKIRSDRNLQQKAMADIIGCEPSYLSALETGSKPPPQNDKLIQFLRKLNLSIEDEIKLLSAAKKSRRTIMLPSNAASRVFEVLHDLEEQLPNINDTQLDLITIALRFNSKELGAPM